MGLEIERKFLLLDATWKKTADEGSCIKQGYLNLEPERTVRVRILGDKGILTVKGKTVDTTRLEFEYEIPFEDAMQLIGLCEKPIVEKIRYKIRHGNHIWEIDVFEGDNQGLIVAEVELENENEKINFPAWIGAEVSHDQRYYNSNLIKQPYNTWS